MAYLPNNEFKELVTRIHETNKAIKLTPKELLAYFGVTSRRTNTKWWIDKELSDNDLITIPNYKSVWIHSEIELTSEKISKEEEDDTITQRIKLLKSANTTPVYITKNDTVEKAMTIMMENDYSQLPVMNSLK